LGALGFAGKSHVGRSKQAGDKLSEVFTVAFQTREDAQRKDKMGPTQPPPAKTTATQPEA